MLMKRALVVAFLACLAVSAVSAQVGSFTKVQVADKIRKVEDGVDEFRKWSENRAENGKNSAEAAKASGLSVMPLSLRNLPPRSRQALILFLRRAGPRSSVIYYTNALPANNSAWSTRISASTMPQRLRSAQ